MTIEVNERPAKRAKLDDAEDPIQLSGPQDSIEGILPPSYVLLERLPRPSGGEDHLVERDVGITEYISKDLSPIEGIIKQRFTDFMVYEVDEEYRVVRLQSIEKPLDGKKETECVKKSAQIAPPSAAAPNKSVVPTEWSDEIIKALAPIMSERVLKDLEELFVQGPKFTPELEIVDEDQNPPMANEAGVNELQAQSNENEDITRSSASACKEHAKNVGPRERKGRGRYIKRRKTGVDERQVLSDVIPSKEDRSNFHKAIRKVFGGQLDTTMTSIDNSSTGESESRIAIKWAQAVSKRSEGGSWGAKDSPPPFIHFTMQKTNRDTHDALSQLSRTLHANVKDLTVAGTKDKRGVTTQRVSLKRQNKTIEDIWKMANGLGRLKTMEQILSERADHGIRIGDLAYRKAGLKLGMLKGNAFVITLRNVKFDSDITVNAAIQSVREKGFINYYGMQRFGTAAVPTHAIGLALLRSDWHLAVSLILRRRPGEHPDADAARKVWLEEKNLDKALQLMPRRIVAERCLLESYKKQGGDTRNAMGTLSTIPRNLRLMYIHSYQSYVWNAVVSERIRRFGHERPVPGDLVWENGADVDQTDMNADGLGVRDREGDPQYKVDYSSTSKPKSRCWAAKVKVLTETDAPKYSIFDVVMPLPGKDVAFPGGPLGKLYREFLVKDGLDPDNFDRKQKEYVLGGSYRKILHLPRELSWKMYQYTDPDLPLAQADEDILLGFKPVTGETDGKFNALQIKLTLGTAAYATMALREVLKADTSSQHQSSLTQAAEDQHFKGTDKPVPLES